MSDLFLIINFILLIVALIIIFLLYKKLSQNTNKDDDKALLLLQEQLNNLNQNFDNKLSNINKELNSNLFNNQKALQQQYEHNSKIYQNITEKLSKLENTNSQIMNFSQQLQDLQNILKNPKQRGILGEFYLNTILENILPPNSYSLQYKLGKDEKTGQELIVDAAIFIQDKIIPIDSKFSLENYEKLRNLKLNDDNNKEFIQKFKQDLKNRIDETAKYIRPDLGTMDFAFMFIPAEAVYYDLLVNKVGSFKTSSVDLIEYAMRQKKVIIVSPTSFLAYLQTVLQGLRALEIEESAKEIKKNVEALHKHLRQYNDIMKKLGGHLSTTVNAYNNSYKEFNKIDKDLNRLSEKKLEKLELIQIEKPNLE